MTSEMVEWSALPDLEESARTAAMVALFEQLAAASDEVRREALSMRARTEAEMDDAQIYKLAVSRLRAWLAIGARDVSAARVIIDSYARVQDKLPAAIAMRRATVMQGVARHELSVDETALLVEFTPRMARDLGINVASLRLSVGTKPDRQPQERSGRKINVRALVGGVRRSWLALLAFGRARLGRGRPA